MTPTRQDNNPIRSYTSGRRPHRVAGRTAERHGTAGLPPGGAGGQRRALTRNRRATLLAAIPVKAAPTQS
jgi:hypothetical protein